MNHFKLIVILGFLNSWIFTQSAEINKISVAEKVNGTLIRIGTNNPVSNSQITAWISDPGWLYVTLLTCKIDTTRYWPPIGTRIVSEFQAHQFINSVQLDFRLTHQIEDFEVEVFDSNQEVVILLRFPVSEGLADLQRLQDLEGNELQIDRLKPLTEGQKLKKRLPYVFLVVGGGFITSGLLQSSGIEFVIGSAIFISGYYLLKR